MYVASVHNGGLLLDKLLCMTNIYVISIYHYILIIHTYNGCVCVCVAMCVYVISIYHYILIIHTYNGCVCVCVYLYIDYTGIQNAGHRVNYTYIHVCVCVCMYILIIQVFTTQVREYEDAYLVYPNR